MNARELRVDAALAGQRLDQALAALTPELGLRGRRRLIARGAVLVNGRVGDAGCRLRPGDVLALRGTEDGTGATPCSADMPRLLSRQGDYCFLYKPAGLHSAALAGDNGPSLEALLPVLLSEESGGRAPRLMQRLDYGTSGIVCAALGAKAAQAFRVAERAGRCEKRYLALLRGTLAGPSTVRLALDTADRRQSRVLADTDDTLRWTEFLPLHVWGGAAATGPLAGLVRDTAHGESTSSASGAGEGRSRQPDPGRLPHPLRRAASDPGTRGGPGPSPLGGRPVWPVGSIRPGRKGILSAPRGPAAARRGLCAIAALAAARSPGRGGQEMA